MIRFTYQGVNECLQNGLLAFPILFVSLTLISHIFVCQFVDEFYDIQSDIGVFMTQKAHNGGDLTRAYKFRIRQSWDLGKRKQRLDDAV